MQRIVKNNLMTDQLKASEFPSIDGMGTRRLFARRSVFRRKGSRLLVTEVFLPEILKLVAR